MSDRHLVPQGEIDAAKTKIVDVVGGYIKLEREGGEYVACCPFHKEKSPSFKVNPEKLFYYCFGCGATGDTVDFVMSYKGISSFRDALRLINGSVELQPVTGEQRAAATPRPKAPEKFIPIHPVPPEATKPSFRHYRDGEPAAVWAIPTADGAGIYGYTCRFNIKKKDPETGEVREKKEVRPLCWATETATGECGWHWTGFEEPRPLYGLDLLAANPNATVLIPEGEKATDAARRLLPLSTGLVCVTYLGGGKAIEKTDWEPVRGRKVIYWRDADPEGLAAAEGYIDGKGRFKPGLAQLLDGIASGFRIVEPPADVVKGWDLADAEAEGWSGERVLTHLRANLRPAKPAPVPPEAAGDTKQNEGEIPSGESATDTGSAPPGDDLPAGADGLDEEAGYFRILGYDRETYYILHHERGQIMELSKGDFTEIGLIGLAPLNWWEISFPAEKAKFDRPMAVNWIMRTAHKRGIFNPARRRGRGAWIDDGRSVYHFGGHLLVDGQATPVHKLDSRYIYELAHDLPLPDDQPLTAEEGFRLLELAGMFRWVRPASALLVAGWTMLAPICGALQWRPHIWITGGAGSGKSTVLNGYVHRLTGGLGIYAQGNSSEAGLRQKLKDDAIPVLFDEGEQNDEREAARMQSVLALIRQASTESAAQTYKGTAGGEALHFHVRSMFCLASIQVGIKHQADRERLTVLAIRPRRGEDGGRAGWEVLRDALYQIERDATISGRLFRRSLNMMPVTLESIAVFTKVAAEKFGGQREGDQYGTMVAGAWVMAHDAPPTPEQARALLDAYDWTEYTEESETEESTKVLAALMEAGISVNGGIRLTVYELIRACEGYDVSVPAVAGNAPAKITSEVADAVLQRHGMRVQRHRLLLANNSVGLRKLFTGTPYEADFKGQLVRVPGINKNENRSVRFNGVASKCVSIPLELVIEGYTPGPEPAAGGINYEEDIPF